MRLAPIVLFVYNRVQKLKETISYLKKNIYASESDLFIFSDGHKDNELDYQRVKEVRDYIENIEGFRKIEIIKSDKNKGLANSIINGVTEVINIYNKIVVLEDDLIPNPFFLKFINKGLEIYEDSLDVISIHGFIYPVKSKLPDTFFLKGADCWGWGTWKRGWDLFEKDANKLLKKLEEKKLTYKFDFNGSYPFTEMLKHQIEGKVDSWAIRWYASAFLNDKFTLYPGKSLIGNIGMDEGTHCKNDQCILNFTNEDIELKKIKKIKENLKAKKIIIKEYFNKNKKKFEIINLLKKIKNRLAKFF